MQTQRRFGQNSSSPNSHRLELGVALDGEGRTSCSSTAHESLTLISHCSHQAQLGIRSSLSWSVACEALEFTEISSLGGLIHQGSPIDTLERLELPTACFEPPQPPDLRFPSRLVARPQALLPPSSSPLGESRQFQPQHISSGWAIGSFTAPACSTFHPAGSRSTEAPTPFHLVAARSRRLSSPGRLYSPSCLSSISSYT